MARTAAVAGTASAVSGRVAHHQQEKFAAQDAAAAPPPPGPATHVQAPDPDLQAPEPDDPVAKLKELAQLKEQGALTDEEFATMKAKVLAG